MLGDGGGGSCSVLLIHNFVGKVVSKVSRRGKTSVGNFSRERYMSRHTGVQVTQLKLKKDGHPKNIYTVQPRG